MVSGFVSATITYYVTPLNFLLIPFNFLARNLGKAIGFGLVSLFTVPAYLGIKVYYGSVEASAKAEIAKFLETHSKQEIKQDLEKIFRVDDDYPDEYDYTCQIKEEVETYLLTEFNYTVVEEKQEQGVQDEKRTLIHESSNEAKSSKASYQFCIGYASVSKSSSLPTNTNNESLDEEKKSIFGWMT